jgi:hypothetical protein
VRPDQEKELLDTMRRIDANTSEQAAMIREIKLWRKFVAWAFGIATTAMGVWQLWRDFRGL